MRAFKIVVFVLFLYAAAAWGGEVYGPGGEIEGYTLELKNSIPVWALAAPPDVDHLWACYADEDGVYHCTLPGLTALLRECLEFIEDGSVDQNRALQAAIYRPLTRDGVAQDEADRAQHEAERYRRETELHKKIKAMIKKLEGENK